MFYVYDCFIQRRNAKLVAKAAQTSALVKSLFPKHVRDQLMETRRREQELKLQRRLTKQSGSSSKGFNFGASSRMKSFLSGSDDDADSKIYENGMSRLEKPIADLFLESTVMFAGE